MSEVGDRNHAAMAAKRANSETPPGTVLVIPAKAPTRAAGVSTASTAGATITAGLITAPLLLLFPSVDPELIGAAGVVLAFVLNFLFSWLRHRRENAAAPGVGVAP